MLPHALASWVLLAAASTACSPKGAPATSAAAAAAAAEEGSNAEGQAAPEPIDGQLPSPPTVPDFSRRAECPRGACNLENIIPDAVRPAAGEKVPVWVWEQVIPRGTTVVFPRHADVDIYGVLLEGEVSITADDTAPTQKEKQKRVWPWMAFRAPGAGVNLIAKEPTRILLLTVATAAGSSAAQAIDALAKKGSAVGWTKRAAAVSTVDLLQRPDLSWGKGAYHARLGFESTAEEPQSAYVGALLLSKNAPVAEHVHAKEWEVLAVLEGDGELVRTSDASVKVVPGVIVAIPPGVAHSWKPSGKASLLGIQFYAPPGPEQRFKKLAEPAK